MRRSYFFPPSKTKQSRFKLQLQIEKEEVEDEAHSQRVSVVEDEGEEGVASIRQDKVYNATCVKNLDTQRHSVGTMLTKK